MHRPMRRAFPRMPRRVLAILLAGIVAAMIGLAPGSALAAGSSPHANTNPPNSPSSSTVETYIRTWLNHDRAIRGLRSLRVDVKLPDDRDDARPDARVAGSAEPLRTGQPGLAAERRRRPLVRLGRGHRLVVVLLGPRRRAVAVHDVEAQPRPLDADDELALQLPRDRPRLPLAGRGDVLVDRVRRDARPLRPDRPDDGGRAERARASGSATRASTRSSRPTPRACATTTSSTGSTAASWTGHPDPPDGGVDHPLRRGLAGTRTT